MLMIAEAKVKDLATMSWFTYTGEKAIKLGTDKQFNQKHPLVVRPGELVGLKKAARGPGAGNYQVVLGHAVHVLFRNVTQKMIDKIEGKLKPYKGKPPEHGQLQEGKKRTTKVRIREKETSDKLVADLFKPEGPVRENATYNRENYQWRRVVHAGVAVKSLKQGRSKYSTQEGDVVGMRYMTKARGGFIILPNMQRVNIDHDTYMKLIESTRIQPSSKQQKGIVILADVKATLPKETRNRKKKEPEPDVRIQRGEPEKTAGRRMQRDIKGFTHDHDIPDVDIEDDELEDEAPSQVPEAHQPAKVIRVGSLLQSAKRPDNKFAVVDAEVHETYTEFSLYSLRTKDVRKLRMSNDTDMSNTKSVLVLGDVSKSELAAGKRAFNKAVKDKKFTVGTIHDQ
ncbi:hypothetical protein O152_gp269 [Pseudomonas phage PaBG]|uniref:KTSC and Metallopeptidase-like N-terminal fusion domain-containing protein n=1 Tax=Pseudomonas phage PaBG TaxID=1335230 RepID=S5VVB9_9CAUD|nr:hypothetical protein O152_gp269 [Pseudomonas phage PaBG]AGS82092.1 hypothetical protein PaBG_00217 [Pseudomonas phage PaBG]